MKTLILKNIVSSNTVYQLNKYIKINQKSLGKIKVLFLAQSESNRNWKLHETPTFDYQILKNMAIELKGKDLFTYFINPGILKSLKEFNPDRLIISGWDLFSYQFSFFWGKLNKKQITLWSGSTKKETSWRRSLTIPLVRLFVYLSTDFIAYGSRAKDYLVNLGADPEKVKIFPNDVNGDYFRKEVKKYSSNRKTQKNLLYVGQLIHRKGLLDLLVAYQEFKKKHQNWGLIIVGSGQLESEMKQIIKKANLKNVKMLGFIEQYDLPKIYATSSILVLPSRQEVWGLVVNEALHSGLKVVVGDKCGCVEDLVKQSKNGYIFKSGNTKDLTKKLIQAASSY